MTIKTLIGLLLLASPALAAPTTNPAPTPATKPTTSPDSAAPKLPSPPPVNFIRIPQSQLPTPQDDPHAKQLMTDALSALNNSADLHLNATLDRLETPPPNITDPSFKATHRFQQWTFYRHGQKAFKLSTTVSQYNSTLLFDGSIARVTDKPDGSGSSWTPQQLDVDWVFSHGPPDRMPGRGSPLIYFLTQPARDYLLQRAVGWRYLGELDENYGQDGTLDRIDFRFRNATWEVWISRDSTKQIRRLIYNGFNQVTAPAPVDPNAKPNTPTQMITVRFMRRDEWAFSWNLSPKFADDEFKFKDTGQTFTDVGNNFDPEVLHPGTPAPDFELSDLDGKTVKLSEQIGSIVVLEFWASRNRLATRDLAITRAAIAKYADQGVLFLTINPDEPGLVRQTMTQNNLGPFPVLRDLRNEVRRAYLVGGFPYIVIISREGSVFRVLRQMDDSYEPDISPVLDAALAAETH